MDAGLKKPMSEKVGREQRVAWWASQDFLKSPRETMLDKSSKASLRAEIKILEGDQYRLSEKNKFLSEENARLTSEHATAWMAVAETRKDNEILLARIASFEAKAAEEEKAILNLYTKQLEIESFEKEKAASNIQIKELERYLESASEQYQSMIELWSKASKQNEELLKTNAELTSEKNDLQSKRDRSPAVWPSDAKKKSRIDDNDDDR